MSQFPSQQPGHQPQYGTHVAPAQNGLAVAGFVLSIVGFFSCCLTSPVGLILSIMGMKKTDQQGLAIAGIVMGIMGTLGLLALIVYFVVVIMFLGGVAFWANEAMASASERAQTMAAINMARQEVERQVNLTRSLPDDFEGEAIASRQRDAWRKPLRYERLDDNHYEISSAGPDGEFDTRDDIKQTFMTSQATSARSNDRRQTLPAWNEAAKTQAWTAAEPDRRAPCHAVAA